MMSKLGKLKIKNTVFFVCDVQERFRPLIDNFSHVLTTSSALVKAGKLLEIPVIATEQYPEKLGPTCPELDIRQSPQNKVFSKLKFSMLTPEVETCLEKLNRKQVVLCGIETHVCVLQTSLDLLEKGYEVHVLVDGVSSQRQLDRGVALKRMEQAGCVPTTFESSLFLLTQSKTNPLFSPVSALAKQYSQDVQKHPSLSAL